MNKRIIVGSGGFGKEFANVALISDVWDQIFLIDYNTPQLLVQKVSDAKLIFCAV